MDTIKLSTGRKKDNLNTSIIALYFLLCFFSLYEFQLILINSLIVLLGLYLFIANFNYIVKKHYSLLWIFLLFAIYSSACLFLFQDRVTYTPIRVMVHFALFITLIRYNINSVVIKWGLYIYVMYMLYLIFVRGIYINAIFPGSSKNIVGWFSLGLCVLYYVAEVGKKNIQNANLHFNLLPAILTLLLCLVTLGRSNIVCSFLLLFVVLWYNLKRFSIVKKMFFTLLIAIFTISVVYIFYDLLESGLQRFDQRGFESYERDLMIVGYRDKLDFYTFLLGVNSDQYPFTILNGNFHNSFLGGHSSFGLMFILFIGFIVQLFIKNFFKSFIFVMLSLVLLIRSYTDAIMFIGFFDFVLFVLLFKIKKN
ncbi:hypothetical protein [Myroides indicus]|uniref:O-antigen ligase-like membrane protein n=1 Tax=Myroides indicus TaxID=1323422 RepID=A0A4R7F3L3_9FLAO|nr:hypothetical protein [Myroides indicus]TDS65016.1 hypothetical protein C8P70_10336 [Myroides indicus]